MLVYLAVNAITPGPNNLMCLYLGATVKLKGAKNFMLGSFTGLFVKSVLCGLLNVLLAEIVPALVPYLKWVGAAYMLYLGYTMIKSGFEEENSDGEAAESSDRGSTFMSGIVLQCLNIKSWISALSMFSVYVIPFTTDISAVFLSSAAYLGLIAVSSLIWVLFGQTIQAVYKKHRLLISILMGLSLAVCAVMALI